MKLPGQITFLVSEDGATIEIRDPASSMSFLKVELTSKQLCQALSRLGHTPCELEVRGLDRVGKKMIMDELKFEIPDCDYKNRKDVAAQEAEKVCPPGWEPDNYYGSQKSFFEVNGTTYARTTIRRWE